MASIDEVLSFEQFNYNGYWDQITPAGAPGAVRFPGRWMRATATPLVPLGRPPRHGEHDAELATLLERPVTPGQPHPRRSRRHCRSYRNVAPDRPDTVGGAVHGEQLDLSTTAGCAIVAEFVRWADAVSNRSPPAAASLGCGGRVHSGLVSEVCVDLFEAAVVEGPMVATQMVNSPRMRTFAHRNPAVQLGPLAYTHGAGLLATLHRFTALLVAVEVGLDGSVNSEMRGGEIISGPGGAPNFAFAAALATVDEWWLAFPRLRVAAP